jgi:hypothetical protein
MAPAIRWEYQIEQMNISRNQRRDEGGKKKMGRDKGTDHTLEFFGWFFFLGPLQSYYYCPFIFYAIMPHKYRRFPLLPTIRLFLTFQIADPLFLPPSFTVNIQWLTIPLSNSFADFA